jgi:hypothetical protein
LVEVGLSLDAYSAMRSLLFAIMLKNGEERCRASAHGYALQTLRN